MSNKNKHIMAETKGEKNERELMQKMQMEMVCVFCVNIVEMNAKLFIVAAT